MIVNSHLVVCFSCRYDISKLPDIYEGCKYDIIHNQSLKLDFNRLFDLSRSMAIDVIENEYGTNPDNRTQIASRISYRLIQKILGVSTLRQSLYIVYQVNFSGFCQKSIIYDLSPFIIAVFYIPKAVFTRI